MRRPSIVPAALLAFVFVLPAAALGQKLAPCGAKKMFDRMPVPSGTPIAMVAGHEFRKTDVCVPVEVRTQWKDRYKVFDHSLYEMTAREAYPGEFWYRTDSDEWVIVANGKNYSGNDRLLSLVASGEGCHHNVDDTCDKWTAFGTDDVVVNEVVGSKTGSFLYGYPDIITEDEDPPTSVDITAPLFEFRRSADLYSRKPAVTIDNVALFDPTPLAYRELVTAAQRRQPVSRTIAWNRNERAGEPGDHAGTLTLTIVFFPSCPQPFHIVAPAADAPLLFSRESPGMLTIEAQAGDFANMSPDLIDEITWTAPAKPGASITYDPPTRKGPRVTITYTGLPESNNDFGPTTISASVDAGSCGTLSASQTVRLFFPRDATNNPDGDVPNWFYYWKQTSARVGPVTLDDPAGQCGTPRNRVDGVMGYYRSERLEDKYYMCDLARHGLDNPFATVQINATQDGFDDAQVTGIDTFAVVCHHENGHYTHFRDWWFAHRAVSPFSVAEDPNHNSVKDSVEAVTDPDGDMVPTAVETQKGLDPHDKHTILTRFGFFKDDDEEYLAWVDEARWVIGSANKSDWACPGKQCR